MGDEKCSTTELAGCHDIMALNNICAKSGVNCTPLHTVSLADVYLLQWLGLCSTECEDDYKQ